MIFRAAIFLAGAALGAEPLVTGFERFHAATPTAEGGRLLYNELGCVNCHGGVTGLPTMRGPELATVTQRVRSEWLRKFVADPASVHPGAVMPQVLAKADDKTLVAIEHYLASLKPKAAPSPRRDHPVSAESGWRARPGGGAAGPGRHRRRLLQEQSTPGR